MGDTHTNAEEARNEPRAGATLPRPCGRHRTPEGGARAARNSIHCARSPLRAADLDKLTPYRWKVVQYQADRGHIPSVGKVRIDFCELNGLDEKGTARAGVMVNIARDANADAFARHWHAACADSLLPDARGTVQPLPGVPGGKHCVTANGTSSSHWIESPGRTIQIEPLTESDDWPKLLPQLLAAVAK